MKYTLLFFVLFSIINNTFAQDTKKTSSISAKQGIAIFKSHEYNFGKLKYLDENNKAEFIFKNISKEPIKIINIETSCGCSEASWTKEEIAKKKKGKIYVKYDTKKIGKFNEFIQVYFANYPNPIQLQIKGEVLKEHTNNK